MRIKYISTSFLFMLILSYSSQAQIPSANPKTILINMSASEYVPADIIEFNINVNAEAQSPAEAYALHKRRESLLASLLKKYSIEEENINYQPVRISKRYSDDSKSRYSLTNQSVSISFKDFKMYEDIQVTLIENGFDSFSGNFSSSELEKGKEKALISSIRNAREKAELITKTAGTKLGDILSINYSGYQINKPVYAEMNNMKMRTSSPSMMDFDQMVTVSANISITFALKD